MYDRLCRPQVVRQPATWRDAAAHCQADNTSLAFVGDVFDNARLMKLLYRDGGDRYWLSLSDTKVSSGQGRSGQVRSGQVRAGQSRTVVDRQYVNGLQRFKDQLTSDVIRPCLFKRRVTVLAGFQ